MLSSETAIPRRSNEPNEVLRLDVLVIEYVSIYDLLLDTLVCLTRWKNLAFISNILSLRNCFMRLPLM